MGKKKEEKAQESDKKQGLECIEDVLERAKNEAYENQKNIDEIKKSMISPVSGVGALRGPNQNYGVARGVGPELLKAVFDVHEKAKVYKKEKNPVFSSKYADLPSVLDAVTPLLLANGLAITFESKPPIDPTLDAVMTLHVYHVETGQHLKSSLPCYIRVEKENKKNEAGVSPQGLGSALTYAKRQLLLAVFALPCHDDDGNAGSGKDDEKKGQDSVSKTKDAIKDDKKEKLESLEILKSLLSENYKRSDFFISGDNDSALEARQKYYESILSLSKASAKPGPKLAELTINQINTMIRYFEGK